VTAPNASVLPTLREVGIRFSRHGYFVRSSPLTATPDAWDTLATDLERLKHGDFSALRGVLHALCEQPDWLLKRAAATILGNAGTLDEFRAMREFLECRPARARRSYTVEDREYVLQFCRAFTLWGRLDVVPVLVDQYLSLRLAGTADIAILPVHIADLLTADADSMIAHEPPDEHLDDYLSLVMNTHEALVSRLGSDKQLVFRGELQSTTALAQALRHPDPEFLHQELVDLRERFEPATGIDCSLAFTGGACDPLAAAAIAESFLGSQRAARMQADHRYFFGHAIPVIA